MTRIIARLAGALAGAALLMSPAAAEPVETLKDASRVVAIGGAVTEIVYDLGEQSRLIARDSTSVFPQEAMKLPDVGYMRQLSPEGVLSVNPSGIIALEGSGPKEAVDVLRKASVDFVEIPETFDAQGIRTRIERVGKALGVEARAAELADKVEARLEAAEAATAHVKERKRVLFILSMQGGKVMASGTGSAADGIIRMAGAVNAIDGYAGYKQLSDEAAIEARPDVILMMTRAGPGGVSDEELFGHPAIAPTPAGQNRKVVRMDGAYLLGFGPRTADAVHDLSKTLSGAEITQ